MGRELVFLCVDDPDFKKRVEQMGERVTRKEVGDLFNVWINCPENSESPLYCPMIYCDEGSIVHQRLVENNLRYDDGRSYSIVKEVIVPEKKKRSK